jgi:hypothetical protein
VFRRLALVAALILAVFALPVGASADGRELREPPPAWMTPEIRERISDAGPAGVPISRIRGWLGGAQTVTDPCPGVEPYATPQVSAGACQVFPAGCTANFIYHTGEGPFTEISDGRNHFIGIAGHCVDHAKQPVFMQIFTGVIAKVGEVKKLLAGDIGRNGRGIGGIGNDFAIIEIDQGFKVEPRSPAGGPQGIYTGCEPRPVKYWGHGLVVGVGQGRIEGGLATNWFDRSYGWTGVGFPGDSGSGVILADTEQAAGNLTHLLIDFERYPGSDLAGTRVTRALTWMGADYFLVNQDRTKMRATLADTNCGNANAGRG